MNEYDGFENVFSSINQKQQKMSNSKIIHRIKNFTAHFPSEHHFRPSIFNVASLCRILDILSFLKSIVKYSCWDGARGAYLAHGLIRPVLRTFDAHRVF